MKLKLYAVFYTFNGAMDFEGITTDFDKWIKEHNEERKKDGNSIEEEFCFESFQDWVEVEE